LTTELLEVGRVDKPHGLRGEVIVTLTTDRTERLDPGSVLLSDVGELVVTTVRPHQHRFIVQFEGVADREGSDRLRGVVLRAEPLDEPGTLWVHDLVGSVVVEPDGTERGRVEAVQANPASDLLVLDTGALVPVQFVTESAEGRVVVDVPAGLFDL
jgi:16S rRNA processing protein RimM